MEKVSETAGLILLRREKASSREILGIFLPDLQISVIWWWSSANLSKEVAVMDCMVLRLLILSKKPSATVSSEYILSPTFSDFILFDSFALCDFIFRKTLFGSFVISSCSSESLSHSLVMLAPRTSFWFSALATLKLANAASLSSRLERGFLVTAR